jgi:hypothetical protein
MEEAIYIIFTLNEWLHHCFFFFYFILPTFNSNSIVQSNHRPSQFHSPLHFINSIPSRHYISTDSLLFFFLGRQKRVAAVWPYFAVVFIFVLRWERLIVRGGNWPIQFGAFFVDKFVANLLLK